MTDRNDQTAARDPRVRRRINAAGIAGNVLEWYDFALYGYLATIIAGQFFPSTDPLAALISTYGVFAIGFLARPLGGVIYGIMGDRLGRRRLLTISVVMMGLPTFSDLKAKGAMDRHPLRTALRDHPREIAVTAGLNWTMSTGYYIVFVWLTTDLSKIVGLPLSTALAITAGGLFVGALATPIAGLLADRIGGRAMLAAAGSAMTLAAVPLLLLAGLGSVATATAGQLLLALIMAGFMGTLPAVFVSLNRAAVRCSALSVGYNLAQLAHLRRLSADESMH